jgi:asparagine synthase (glutamine-hydrolysing)
MIRLDKINYLFDDILVKVERASIANSLETRLPFPYHRLIEFALGLPMDLKFRNSVGKWILKEVLY